MHSPISIACVGDVMCGDSFYNIGKGCASSIKKYGEDFLDKKIVNLFRRHDIVFGNMESPISDKGKKTYSLRSQHMRASSTVAPYLSSWGFTVLNVANNHILEHGHNAAVETVRHLITAGIEVIGGGNKLFQEGFHIRKLPVNNSVVIFMAICLRKEKYAYDGGGDVIELLECVKKHSVESPVIVSIHWGDEFIDRPSSQVRKVGRMIIENGATAVIGHHPHVVQGIERYQKGIIAYSLGNFIFDSFEPDCRWSIILSLRIDESRNVEWQCFPFTLDSSHRPCLSGNEVKQTLLNEVERRSIILRNTSNNTYKDDLNKLEKQFAKNLKKHLLKNIFNSPWYYWPQILFRPIQRRLQIW